MAFTYPAVASGRERKHASLKAHRVDRSISELCFTPGHSVNRPCPVCAVCSGKSGMMRAQLSSDGATACVLQFKSPFCCFIFILIQLCKFPFLMKNKGSVFVVVKYT